MFLFGFASLLINCGGGEPSKRFHSGKSSVRRGPKKYHFSVLQIIRPQPSS